MRLRQAVGKHSNQIELIRLGCQLDADGKARRFYPRTFEMKTEAGYWSRAIAPKMDEAIEKAGLSTARGRILGKLPKKVGQEQTIPKGKAKATRRNSYWKERKEPIKPVGGKSVSETPPEDSGRMYPVGARLTKTERNCAVANGPRNPSDEAICWDFDSRGGCKYGNKCFNAHETMLPTGVHWCEMIRRGGFKKEKRVSPTDVGGVVRSFRESNAGVHGEQKVLNINKSGRRKICLQVWCQLTRVISEKNWPLQKLQVEKRRAAILPHLQSRQIFRLSTSPKWNK